MLDTKAPKTTLGQTQVAATCFLTLFSIVGLALYGLPFFYDFMVRDFGWSRAQVTSGNALSKLIVGPLFGFLAGWIIDRYGPKKMLLTGIMLAGLALVGLSVSTTLFAFYFFYLLNALGYVCGGPLPNQVLLSQWFDKSRGKAMGFAYLGIGIGGALVPLLSVWLIQRFSWQIALRILGFLIMAISLPLALLVSERQSWKQREDGVIDSAFTLRNVFKGAPFYLLALGSMCSIGAVGGVNQNLKLFLGPDRHYPQQEIASVISTILACSILGRLLMGWLADRWQKKHVMLLIYLIVAASIPFLFFASSPKMIYAFAILFGIGLGGDYMIIPLMAAELFGIKALGRVMGLILTADGISESLSPMLVARLRDVTGSYHSGFSVTIGLALIGAIAVAFMPNGRTEGQGVNIAG